MTGGTGGSADPPAVVEAGLHRVRLPLLAPHVAAHGTEDDRHVILVSVTDGDGVTGWGECPTLARPGYGSEWTSGAWAVLRDRLVPRVLARRSQIGLDDHPMASGALRDALVDLRLRGADEGPTSVAGPLAERVAFGVALGLADDPGLVAAEAEEAQAAGARLVVVKIRPGWAVAPVSAVRRACPDLAVAVDANGSFSADGLDELREVAGLGLDFVEQPVAYDDPEASAALTRLLDVPVALDEAVGSSSDLEAAVARRAGRMLTVKASRLGGLERALAATSQAAAAGWSVHAGGMLESGVGRAVARVVAARPEVSGPGLVGPTSLLFADDVVDPVGSDAEGLVAVHPGPGLAPPPAPDRLRALTVERWRTR